MKPVFDLVKPTLRYLHVNMNNFPGKWEKSRKKGPLPDPRTRGRSHWFRQSLDLKLAYSMLVLYRCREHAKHYSKVPKKYILCLNHDLWSKSYFINCLGISSHGFQLLEENFGMGRSGVGHRFIRQHGAFRKAICLMMLTPNLYSLLLVMFIGIA